MGDNMRFREENRSEIVVLDRKEVKIWELKNEIKIEYLNDIDYLNMIKEIKGRKVLKI